MPFLSDLVGRLWRGQFPLIVAFWGFYVAGYLATAAVLLPLIAPLFNAQPWRLIAVILVVVPYNVVSAVGVWRSANAYPLTRWWPRMAQAVVMLWELWVAWSMTRGVLSAIAEMGSR
jgi:hypothetical protein